METAIVEYRGTRIEITASDVKSLICPLATEKEIMLFLKTCQSLNLNPFANECYLIKYSEHDKAALVVAIDSYLKAAEVNSNYDGHEAGIILREDDDTLNLREGSFLLNSEKGKLVGGWARVYRKDRNRPFYVSVNIAECLRYRRDGTLTEFWSENKQPSMLRKTALKRALIEAFPGLFAGTLSNVDVADSPDESAQEDGTLPPAYMKDDKENWRKWWARQAEKGLYEDEIRTALEVKSIKEDWTDKGHTLEEADKKLNEYLKKKNAVEGTVVKETGKEEIFSEEPAPAKTVKERTKDDIKSFGDLYQACKDDFKMKTRQEVWDELSGTLNCTVKSQTDIPCTPWECYKSIKDARSK